MSGNGLQAAIQQLQDELVTYQRHALFGTLSGIVAHEFNNILTPVLVRAQDARDRNDINAMRKALDCTVCQTQRALDVARNLIALARGEMTPRQPCAVSAVVDAALAANPRPFQKDGIDLDVRIADDLSILASPVLIEQVLFNLLQNARQSLQGRCGNIRIRAGRDGDFACIDVSDNGNGVDRERIESVINPFLSADAKVDPVDRTGVGMGLNVCRIIAQAHGASLRASPNEGTGSTFQLRWPTA